MARTKAVPGAGARLASHLAVAYLAMVCPQQRVRQVRPIGPQGMPGVWYRDLRVMGLDGSTLEVADEAANAQRCGYAGASRGSSALPQLHFAALAECGTHVVVDAQKGSYGTR